MGEELENKLQSLKTGCVCDGFAEVYKLWKSLLEKWFSTVGTSIYLSSPIIDSVRLRDVIGCYLRHRTEGQMHTFFVQQLCDPPLHTVEVQRQALSKFSAQLQTLIEYKIFRHMVYPQCRLNVKFIAGIKNGEAEVLLTSASFHAEHFTHKSLENVCFVRMSQSDFEQQYLEHLTAV